MRKKYNHKVINFRDFRFILETQDTSYGFRHLGTLSYQNSERLKETLEVSGKCTYYNRTWESYDYQTLIRSLFEKFTKQYRKTFEFKFEKPKFDIKELMSGIDAQILGKEEESDFFSTLTKIAKLGELLTDTKEESNIWKKKMIAAGIPGLSFPDDWDTLSEEEKESRLNKVIEFAKGDK
jgi:hypothetical protein